MWIQTQNKQRILNTNHVIDIYVDKTGKVIYAETSDEQNITLGEYDCRDTCLKILEHMFVAGFGMNVPLMTMPLGGEIDEWEKDLAGLASVQILRGN